jgi:putative hydrolase of HD superfamily
MNDIEKCFEFIIEAEKLKAVTRRTKPPGLDRYENSAEHSWQIALLAVVLAKFSQEPVNLERVVKMLLVHDLGEIEADDVFFFDEAGRAAAKEAELRGVNKLFAKLPAETADELLELWLEFENGDSVEAKYARAVDRVMPILQNLNNDRQSWKENGVTREQILTKTAYIADGSAVLWESISAKIVTAFEGDR